MRRALMLVAALALAVAGFGVAVSALRETVSARKHLVNELSTAMGPARALDVVNQQLRAEQGTAKSAQVLLADALKAARTPEQRAALQQALSCVADGGCVEAQALLVPVQAYGVAALQQTWEQVDSIEERSRSSTWLGLVLVLAGVLLTFVGGRADSRPAPAPPVNDTSEVERLLRERLEALYSARAQLGDEEGEKGKRPGG